MFKRFISVLLTAQLILSGMTVFAADTAEVLISEGFSTYATNSEYSNADGAYGTRVMEEPGNKYLLLIAGEDGASLTIPAEVSGKFTVSMDVMLENRPSEAVYMAVNDSSGRTAELFAFSDGEFMTGDGKKINQNIKNNEWTNLTYKIDFGRKKFDVMVNGVAAVLSWPIPNTAITSAKTLSLEIEGNKEKPPLIGIDNIRVYTGLELKKDFAFEPYNDEEMYFDPDYVEEESDADIYAAIKFDTAADASASGVLYTEKSGSKLDLISQDENKYIRLTRTESDPYIDVAVDIDNDRYVIQADFMPVELGGNVLLFHMRDSAAQFNQLIGLNGSGAVTTPKGGTVGQMKKNEWINIACLVNAKKQVYDVYINGELVKEKIPFSNTAFSKPSTIRTTFSGDAARTSLAIDNIYVYSGKNYIAEFDSVKLKQVYTSDEVAQKALKGTTAFTSYNGAAWINEEKVMLENKPLEEDNTLYAPAELYEKAYNAEVKAYDGKYYVNDTEVNGKERDGVIYLDFASVAQNAIKLNYFMDAERGFAIMGSKSFSAYQNPIIDYNGNNYLVLSRGEKEYLDPMYYLLYERPSAESVLERFNEKTAGQHPRIMGTEADFDRIRQEAQTDPIKSAWAKSMIARADGLLEARTMPVYELTGGERLSTPSLSSFFTLSFAYQLTKDPKYAESIYEEVLILKDFPDWHPMHFLDTASNTAAVSVAYDWCYDYWSEEQRENIKDALYRHGLKTGYNDLYGGATRKWTGFNNNWSAVCWGSLGMAAVALMDDYPEEASEVISGGLKGIGYMIPMFTPNGAWPEGTGYWNYCLTWYTRYMATLESAFGTDFGYLDQRGVRDTMLFPYAMEGSNGIFNFHDATAGSGVDKMPNSYLSYRFKDDRIQKMRLAELSGSVGGIDDFFFLDTAKQAENPTDLPLDITYGLTETGVMRSAWFEKGATFVGYHCSPNSPVHRNFDSGTFVFDSMGVRWAEDLGADSYYIPNYWATEDNPVYRVRTEGQNCYVINPGKGQGQRFENEDKIIKTESKPRGGYGVMDITDAYKDDVTKAIRGVMLGDNRQTMTVRDEIDFIKESEFYWFMHTKADIKIEGNTAILERNGVKMKFEFISNQNLTLDVMDAVPLDPAVSPQNAENVGVKKLVIKGNVRGHLDLTVKITPQAMYYLPDVSDTPISEWTIPDGDIPSSPKLTGIYANGNLISGFTPTNKSYVMLKASYEDFPEITALCEDGIMVEITHDGNGNYSIIAKDKNNETNISVYGIGVKNFVDTPGTENMRALIPVSYEASAEPEAANTANHIMDANNETRWSADGTPTMTYTFSEPVEMCGIGIAFYQGAKRSSYFEIQISDDGENFTTIKDCADTSRSESMSLYEFEPVTAKYLRILGKGNDTNEWFSPTELYVFGKK